MFKLEPREAVRNMLVKSIDIEPMPWKHAIGSGYKELQVSKGDDSKIGIGACDAIEIKAGEYTLGVESSDGKRLRVWVKSAHGLVVRGQYSCLDLEVV